MFSEMTLLSFKSNFVVDKESVLVLHGFESKSVCIAKCVY